MAANVQDHCPRCGGPGPFYHRIEVLSRIEVVFEPDGSHRILDGAEAEELRASNEDYECGGCGGSFTRSETRGPALKGG